ncbi:MAG: DUF87 domain-containing protein [Candidatus Thorarchaeota archaeon]
MTDGNDLPPKWALTGEGSSVEDHTAGLQSRIASHLEFRPLVPQPLDVMVDEHGVIVGRSTSLHSRLGPVGLGLLGAVSESSDDPIASFLGKPVLIDLVNPHVVMVSGKRGSGKSHTLGVIVEEMARSMEKREIGVSVIVVDVVDVFRQMVEPNTGAAELLAVWGREPRGYPVAVFIPRMTYEQLPDDVRIKWSLHPLAISPRDLTQSDWSHVLQKEGQLSTTMENLIGDVLDAIRTGYVLQDGETVPPTDDFSIEEMIRCIRNDSRFDDIYKPSTRSALVQRLRRLSRMGIFLKNGTSVRDLAVAGRITIVDMAPLGSDAESVLAVLTNILCRQILYHRMSWESDSVDVHEELPPVWLVIDEAQTLVPRSGTAPAGEAIVNYAKLGRRFGCSLILCTQQPSAVSDEAISQVDLAISHALTLEADIRALQQRAPALMPDLFKERTFITSLPRGAALVFDQNTENRRGFLVQVRPRESNHGGSDRLSLLFEDLRLLRELEPTKTDEHVYGTSESDRSGVTGSQDISGMTSDQDDQGQGRDISVHEESSHLKGAVEATTPPFNVAAVSTKRFGPLPEALLEDALVRTMLYSPISHEFLFPTPSVRKSAVSVVREDADPRALLSAVVNRLRSRGMAVESLNSANGIPLVMMISDQARAVVAVATSGNSVCASVVATGDESRQVEAITDTVGRLCIDQ